MQKPFIREMRSLTIKDVPEAGGKNASLGEMLGVLKPKGVNIPDGFVITATAYRHFISEGIVKDSSGKKVALKNFIKDTLKSLDTKNIKDLYKKGKIVRDAIISAELPSDLKRQIASYYRKMEKQYFPGVDVAVRSSATAEDLPGASFAGQQETYLNIVGEENLLISVRKCIASLFTDRAISYRQDKGFDHLKIALSVGVQKMVRSDKASSGVMFTVDTESGFKDIVLVTATWGLGELIVQGEIVPDEYIVYKPFLQERGSTRIETRISADKNRHKSELNQSKSVAIVPIIAKKHGSKDKKMIYNFGGAKSTKIVATTEKERRAYVLTNDEILTLSKWAKMIEDHYSRVRKTWTPMDMEWAKDGKTGELYIVQARPETVQAGRDFSKIKEFELLSKGNVICKGPSVGSQIATGKAKIIMDVKGIGSFKPGEVLVTDMTDPDWEPIMKIASAIVTDKGGRTSHAAIVSRELGIPCIVGTENATRKIKTGQIITVDTTGSEGYVYNGALKFKVVEHNIKKIPKLKTKIMMNIATPDTAFEKSFLPNSGVGLAREEFIIASNIGIHPMALLEFDELKKKSEAQNSKSKINSKFQIPNSELKAIVRKIEEKTAGAKDKKKFYVDNLAYGIAKIGAAFYPKDIIVRFSDFKTNEYRQLIGGDIYEPHEENPMIGWRGASRYYHPAFAPAFALEVRAIKKVREEMGLTNVQVMIPVCRTVEEGKKVIALMAQHGLKRINERIDADKKNPHKSVSNQHESALKVYVMCEIPSNVILADKFLDIFDGMSIGSNDLTQMTLGLDRDGNERIRGIGNENNEAIKILISDVIKRCNSRKKYIGICGQAPSDYPEFAKFLVDQGIQSMSLNPDSVIRTILYLAKNK
jgi:pyruvate,water dikinase